MQRKRCGPIGQYFKNVFHIIKDEWKVNWHDPNQDVVLDVTISKEKNAKIRDTINIQY